MSRAPTRTAVRIAGAILGFSAVLGVAGALAPQTTLAQAPCLAHGDLVKELDERYQERQVGMGIASSGDLLEIFASGDGRSWTLTLTEPNGRSCIMAAGYDWISIPQPNPGTIALVTPSP